MTSFSAYQPLLKRVIALESGGSGSAPNNGSSNNNLDNFFDALGLINDPIALMLTMPDRANDFWVDADAPAGGNGTPANPYNNFDWLGVPDPANLSAGVASQIPFNPATDRVRARGVFRGSQNQRLWVGDFQFSNGAGGFNNTTDADRLVIAPWSGSELPVFDGESVLQPEKRGGDGSNIYFEGGTSQALHLNLIGIEVRNQVSQLALSLFQGVQSCHGVSLYIHDNSPPSSSGAMNGGLGCRMDFYNSDYQFDNCLFERNCGTVTNNVGSVNWRSTTTGSDGLPLDRALNRLVFNNCIVRDDYTGYTGKHSGETTVVINNGFAHSFSGRVIYARGGDIIYNHLVAQNAPVFCVADYQNLNTDNFIDINQSTVISCGRLIASTSDEPTRANGQIRVRVRNTIAYDTLMNADVFDFNRDFDNGDVVPDILETNNNIFHYPNAASFLERDGVATNLTFAEMMTLTGDNTTINAVPDIVIPADPSNINVGDYKPVLNGNCWGAGEGGANIGAL